MCQLSLENVPEAAGEGGLRGGREAFAGTDGQLKALSSTPVVFFVLFVLFI